MIAGTKVEYRGDLESSKGNRRWGNACVNVIIFQCWCCGNEDKTGSRNGVVVFRIRSVQVRVAEQWANESAFVVVVFCRVCGRCVFGNVSNACASLGLEYLIVYIVFLWHSWVEGNVERGYSVPRDTATQEYYSEAEIAKRRIWILLRHAWPNNVSRKD